METIQDLYDHSIELLEGCNTILKDNAELPTINSKLVGLVKDLNEARIKQITGITPEKEK
jgi:hypothetical protein